MFERIMFFIVLALFALVPAGLVYANNQIPDQTQNATLDLGNYKIVPKPEKLWFIINSEAWNTSSGSLHSTPNGACSALYSVAAGYFARDGSTRVKLTGYTVNLIATGSSSDVCLLKRSVEYKNADGSYTKPELDNLSYILQSKLNPAACPETSTPKYLGWYVARVTSTPPTGACWASCEHVYKPSGVSTPPRAEPNNHTDGISLLILPDATTNGKSCDLNMCSPDDPNCSNPPPEDCTPEQKTANGGTCPTPDPDGNKCPDSEKTANGGKCQTPDPDGNKCPDSVKAANGGKCPSGDGSGSCTPEQKAANGGQCPSGGGGTCTSNPVNKKFCDLADWLTGGDDFKLPDQETEVPKREITREELPKAQQINFAAGCPAPETFTAFGKTVSLSYDVACDLMRMIKPFVILAANLMALFIFINSIRN